MSKHHAEFESPKKLGKTACTDLPNFTTKTM